MQAPRNIGEQADDEDDVTISREELDRLVEKCETLCDNYFQTREIVKTFVGEHASLRRLAFG